MALLLRIASFHWLLIMIVWIACMQQLDSFLNGIFVFFCLCICLLKLAAVLLFFGTSVLVLFKYLLFSLFYCHLQRVPARMINTVCVRDKYSFQSLNTIPILVILSCHIRAIVYQELYDITVAFPVGISWLKKIISNGISS